MKRYLLVLPLLLLAHTTLAATPTGILSAVNSNRVANHLSTLKENKCLDLAAQTKLNDMISKNYFSHTTPNGDYFDIFVKFAKYKYSLTSENLAMGYSSDKDIVDAWMYSKGHRDNILNKDFTETGIATGKVTWNGREQNLVVQMFGQPFKNIKSCDS